MEAWTLYLEEFRRRAGCAERQLFDRGSQLAEAAHDAYQAVADRLVREHGWGDEHTLVVMRGLNAAVHDWLRGERHDWEELAEALRARETGLADGVNP